MTILLLLSVVFHLALLAALALHMPIAKTTAGEPRIIEVALVPSPFARVAPSDAPHVHTQLHRPRVVGPDSPAPRYAAAGAPTGEAVNAVDLFGPVFADGLWPRPMKVGHAPCDPAALDRDPNCQRDLMLIGLASDAAARSKAGP